MATITWFERDKWKYWPSMPVITNLPTPMRASPWYLGLGKNSALTWSMPWAHTRHMVTVMTTNLVPHLTVTSTACTGPRGKAWALRPQSLLPHRPRLNRSFTACSSPWCLMSLDLISFENELMIDFMKNDIFHKCRLLWNHFLKQRALASNQKPRLNFHLNLYPTAFIYTSNNSTKTIISTSSSI